MLLGDRRSGGMLLGGVYNIRNCMKVTSYYSLELKCMFYYVPHPSIDRVTCDSIQYVHKSFLCFT